MPNNTSTPIRERVRDIVATSSLSEPHEIAAKLLESATRAERELWLTETLPSIVAEVLRLDRNNALDRIPARTPTRMPSKSAKVSQIRDWWQAFLSSRIPVDGVYKSVGELSAADLRVVIDERRQQAARTLAQAERYELLLTLIGKYKVASPGALPAAARAEFEAAA